MAVRSDQVRGMKGRNQAMVDRCQNFGAQIAPGQRQLTDCSQPDAEVDCCASSLPTFQTRGRGFERIASALMG